MEEVTSPTAIIKAPIVDTGLGHAASITAYCKYSYEIVCILNKNALHATIKAANDYAEALSDIVWPVTNIDTSDDAAIIVRPVHTASYYSGTAFFASPKIPAHVKSTALQRIPSFVVAANSSSEYFPYALSLDDILISATDGTIFLFNIMCITARNPIPAWLAERSDGITSSHKRICIPLSTHAAAEISIAAMTKYARSLFDFPESKDVTMLPPPHTPQKTIVVPTRASISPSTATSVKLARSINCMLTLSRIRPLRTRRIPTGSYMGTTRVFVKPITAPHVMSEARILAGFTCPSIIQLLGLTLHTPMLPVASMILPMAEYGDLHSHITTVTHAPLRIKCALPLHIRIAGAAALIDAIRYLHTSADILHWDLKPENVLVCDAHTFKLCDFDHSRQITAAYVTWPLSTVGWHAPEQSPPINTHYNPVLAEIFSLGLLIFTILVESPFTHLAQAKATEIDFDYAALLLPSRIVNNSIIPSTTSIQPELVHFFNYVCNPNPFLRPQSADTLRKAFASLKSLSQ